MRVYSGITRLLTKTSQLRSIFQFTASLDGSDQSSVDALHEQHLGHREDSTNREVCGFLIV